MNKRPERKHLWPLWYISAFCLLVGLTALVAVSRGYGPRHLYLPILSLTILVHLIAVWRLSSSADSRKLVAFILLAGLALRAPLFFMPVARTADYHRYLWDGALLANGISPYRWTPEQAMKGEVDSPTVQRLAREGSKILQGVNHPYLRTIYPPLAEFLFAISHWIKPFSPGAWRLALLVIDLVTFALLYWMLRGAGLSSAWLCAYFWSPLLIFETYHNRHVDMAMAPFLALCIYGLWRRRPWAAGLGLTLAAAVKLWPALLLPFLIWRFAREWRALGAAVLVCAISGALLFLPYWASLGSETDSGTVAYAKTWYANELAYRPINHAGFALARRLHSKIDGRVFARAGVGILLLLASCWLAAKTRRSGLEDLSRGVLALALLMLLLSPTVYPWYFTPAIVLTALAPRSWILAWTALLPWTALSRTTDHPVLLLGAIHLVGWLLFGVQVWHFVRPEATRNAE